MGNLHGILKKKKILCFLYPNPEETNITNKTYTGNKQTKQRATLNKLTCIHLQ